MRHGSRGWLLVFGILAVAFALLSGRGAAQTTPTLMTVHIVDEQGQPVPGAEAIVTTEERSTPVAGRWKPAQNGTAMITIDDITSKTFSSRPIERYRVIARAKGYAPTITEVRGEPETGQPQKKNVKLTMQKGRPVTLQIVPPAGTQLPADLELWIVPQKFVPATWSGLQDVGPGIAEPVNVAVMDQQPDGKYTFHVTDDSPKLYAMINHPGFLRLWQSENELSLSESAAEPQRIELPKPATVQVKFANQYSDDTPADAEVCLLGKINHTMPGMGGWIVQGINECNPPGAREWTLSDLAPGTYNFSAEEGLVESRNPLGQELKPGETKTISLVAHSVIPPIVAVDENGTTVTGAEARLYAPGQTSVSSHGWQEAKDGAIQFKRSGMTTRFAGDQPISNFEAEVRAPGFAVTNAGLEAGKPTAEPVVVKLDRGRKITLKFTTGDGREIPDDLKPVILAFEHFPRSMSYLWRPEAAPSLAIAQRVSDDTYEFNISEKIDKFYVALNHDDFLRSFASDIISDFAGGTVEVMLPTPGAIQANVTLTSPPLAGIDAELSDKFQYSVMRSASGGSSQASITYVSEMLGETTTVVTALLPPGDYNVSVSPYRNMNRKQNNITVKPGTTTTVDLVAEPGGRVDEKGREIAEFPTYKIVNENGEPVNKAQVIVRKKSTRYIPDLQWQDVGADGTAKLSEATNSVSESADGAYELLVRAPGHASTITEVNIPTSSTAETIALSPGKEVSLQLTAADARAVPEEIRPAVFPESWGRDVWLGIQPDREGKYMPETLLSPVAVQPTGDGRYTLNIDATSTEPLYVLINHPDFLRAFQAGPFKPVDWASSGTVNVELPKPASVVANFEFDNKDAPESSVVTMEISRSQKIPGSGSWSMRVASEEYPVTSATLAAPDLAPGSYNAEVIVASGAARYQRDAYSTRESAELDAGESETLTLVYRPFKEEWLKGPYTAVVKVMNQSGKPAKGEAYKVTWYGRSYGQKTVAEGTVPDDGIVRLENLAGAEKEMSRDDWNTRGGIPSFDMEIGSVELGDISFYDYRDGKFYPPADGKKTKEFTFRIPPKEGDKAPDFEMLDLKTSETMRLSDLKGKIVLIDFWATWCGPCQGPMAENQELMRKHAAEWKDKAVILTVSIDEEQDTVRKYLDKNDWHQTLNTWAPPDPTDSSKSGFNAPAPDLYGVNGIPTMLLVDKEGIIKKRGHHISVEDEMKSLLE